MRGKWMILACVGLAGCQNSHPAPTPTQQALAQKQWSDARAGVLGTLAQDQYRNGNFEKCAQTLEEALRLEPASADLHLLAARLAIEQGYLEIAQQHLARVRQIDPANAEADYLSGVVLQRWQQPQKAYEAYDAAAKKNPQELAYLMAKAEMLVTLNRPADALDLLSAKVVYFEHSAVIRDAVGQLLVQQGRAAEGAAMLREASILDGDDLTIREHLAFALLAAEEYSDAIEEFGELVRDDSYSKRADVFAGLGQCQWQLGQLRDARDSFATATDLDPTCGGYWLSLGQIDLKLNDFPRAALAAEKAVSADGKSAQGQWLLGYVRLRQNRMDEALTAFTTACQIDPTDSVNWCMQGFVLEKLGRAQEAKEKYERALQLKPGDALAMKLLGAKTRPSGPA